MEEAILASGLLIVGLFISVRILIGKGAYAEFIGHWAFEISRAILVFPFKVVKFVFQIFRR